MTPNSYYSPVTKSPRIGMGLWEEGNDRKWDGEAGCNIGTMYDEVCEPFAIKTAGLRHPIYRKDRL